MSDAAISQIIKVGGALVDTLATNYTEFNNTLYSAIRNNNITAVSAFVLNSNTIPFFVYKNKDFIELAYSNRQLESAETLISNGAVFDIKSMFLINDFSCDQIKHITKIKPYITNIQYQAALNLVYTYGCENKLDETVVLNLDSCINIIQYMFKHTVSNIENKSHILQFYKGLQDSASSVLAAEVMKGIVGLTYNMYSPFVVMPVGTRTYFDSANVNRKNKSGFIYLPINNYDKEEHSYAFHELNHRLLNELPGFEGRAYFDEHSKKEYIKAAKATLLNVFTIFHRNVSDYNEIVNNERYDIKYTGEALANHSIINQFIYLNNPDNSLITELLVNEYIGNTTIPALNRKIVFGNFLKSKMEQNGISQDEGYVLARIGEFLKRPIHEWDSELIVRILELEAYGINSKTLEIFTPLREYWEQYISPKIQEATKELPPFCNQEEVYEVALSAKAMMMPLGLDDVISNATVLGNTTDSHSEL